MTYNFKEGELAKVKESHHKVAPKGSTVRIIRQYSGHRVGGEYWERGDWVEFEPIIQRGVKKRYHWAKNRFKKI